MGSNVTIYYDSYIKTGNWSMRNFSNTYNKFRFSYIVSPMANSAMGHAQYFWAPRLDSVVYRNQTVNVKFSDVVRPIGGYLEDNNMHSHYVFFELLKVAGDTVNTIAKRGIYIDDLSLAMNVFEPADTPESSDGVWHAFCKIVPDMYFIIAEILGTNFNPDFKSRWTPGITMLKMLGRDTFPVPVAQSIMLTNLSLQAAQAIMNGGFYGKEIKVPFCPEFGFNPDVGTWLD